MTVYVDDARIPARAGRTADNWSHLYAGPWDDPAELHALAAAIGLRRSWYQDKPWPRGHYDVTEPRRENAIAAGAVPVTWRETGRMMAEARGRGPGNPPAGTAAGDAGPPGDNGGITRRRGRPAAARRADPRPHAPPAVGHGFFGGRNHAARCCCSEPLRLPRSSSPGV